MYRLPFHLVSSPEIFPRRLPVMWCHWKAHPAARWSHWMANRMQKECGILGMPLTASGHVETQGGFRTTVRDPTPWWVWKGREGKGETAWERWRKLSRLNWLAECLDYWTLWLKQLVYWLMCNRSKKIMCEITLMATGVRWRRSRMASGGGPEEERGHRGRNTELRRSISDMNLSLRRRQGNNACNDPRRGSKVPNNGQDRKNIVSMITTEPGEVRHRSFIVIYIIYQRK